jgi:hypothetical protein
VVIFLNSPLRYVILETCAFRSIVQFCIRSLQLTRILWCMKVYSHVRKSHPAIQSATRPFSQPAGQPPGHSASHPAIQSAIQPATRPFRPEAVCKKCHSKCFKHQTAGSTRVGFPKVLIHCICVTVGRIRHLLSQPQGPHIHSNKRPLNMGFFHVR